MEAPNSPDSHTLKLSRPQAPLEKALFIPNHLSTASELSALHCLAREATPYASDSGQGSKTTPSQPGPQAQAPDRPLQGWCHQSYLSVMSWDWRTGDFSTGAAVEIAHAQGWLSAQPLPWDPLQCENNL